MPSIRELAEIYGDMRRRLAVLTTVVDERNGDVVRDLWIYTAFACVHSPDPGDVVEFYVLAILGRSTRPIAMLCR